MPTFPRNFRPTAIGNPKRSGKLNQILRDLPQVTRAKSSLTRRYFAYEMWYVGGVAAAGNTAWSGGFPQSFQIVSNRDNWQSYADFFVDATQINMLRLGVWRNTGNTHLQVSITPATGGVTMTPYGLRAVQAGSLKANQTAVVETAYATLVPPNGMREMAISVARYTGRVMVRVKNYSNDGSQAVVWFYNATLQG